MDLNLNAIQTTHVCCLRKIITVMRLTFILFMITIFCASANNSYSQVNSISLNLENVTLGEALDEIKEKGGYSVWYRNEEIDLDKKISLHVKDKKINYVLDNLLANEGLGYVIEDRHIIIYSKKETSAYIDQAGRQITGVVTDEKGVPIIGVTVIEKGTANGVTTNMEGNFSIVLPDKATLQISYIGYVTQEIVIGEKKFYDIILKEDLLMLDEVVVVGYGTQKKVNLTGSVASLSSKEIINRVQTNVLSAIQGTVPGVTVISRPGQTPSINFRGRGNLGESSPLYIIDGAIADATFFSNIEPTSIESISFLKDAASSAIYGARAAYGVVLVTTKQGVTDKINVTYNGYVGLKMPTYLPDVVSSADYAMLMNEGRYNREPDKGKNQVYSNEEIEKFRNGTDPDLYPNTKWADLVLDQSVLTTHHSINFSGGTEKLRQYTSIGYVFDDNFVPGQKNERYNLSTNVSSKVTNWLTLKTSIKYFRNVGDRTKGSPSLATFVQVPPTYAARQSNGEWGSVDGGKTAPMEWYLMNPLRNLNRNDWGNSKSENTMIDLGFDLHPLPGLVINGQMVYRGSEGKSKSYTALQDEITNFLTDVLIPGSGNKINSMSQSWSNSERMQYMGNAKYNWSNPMHDFEVLLGTSFEHYTYEGLSASRRNFPLDGLRDLNAGSSAGVDISNGGGMSENKLLSYFGRLNYVLHNRYLFEVNFRADASSSFYKDNRWGYFPSFSAGWRISEERFMEQITWIDNLKIRASWGTLGNINNVGYYDYFQNYTMSGSTGYNFNNVIAGGVRESRPANIGLTWETVELTDIGLDLDILGGKLSLTADYYIKNTEDILMPYNVPVEVGVSSSPSQNIASVRNQGVEFALTHRNNIGELQYAISANIATNKNKITHLSGTDEMIRNGGDKIRYIWHVGEAIGSFYGLKTDGLYTQAEIDAGHYYTYGRVPKAGDIKYVPQREHVEWGSAIDSNLDRTVIGNDVPKFTYGLNLNLAWRHFELSVFGQGVGGTSVSFESEQIDCFSSNPRMYHMGRWTEENPNPNATYPRIYGAHSLDEYNRVYSDWFVFNANYFRFKTITLGYDIPPKVIRKAGMSALKVYLTGENLLTIRGDHKMKDFDPEAATGRGVGAFGVKSVALGVNISF